MTWTKQFYYNCTSLLPLQLLLKKGAATSLFPYYHIVSDERLPHIINLYNYKNVKQFSDDLDFLLKRYRPIHPNDLLQYIEQHNELPAKTFLLTFDDGFKEVHQQIAPLLKAKGIPAIFFINPAFIDNKQMFYRNKISLVLEALRQIKEQDPVYTAIAQILSVSHPQYAKIRHALLQIDQLTQNKLDQIAQLLDLSFSSYLEKHRPWLTSAELAQLSAQGFSIGAHSWNHSYFQKLPLEEQVWQTTTSCDYVREITNQRISFSFPHSDKGLSQYLFDLLRQEHGIELLFGIQNHKDELQNKMIHRFNAEQPSLPLKKQVNGMLFYTLVQKILHQQSIERSYA